MSIHTPKKGIEWMTENLVYEAKTLLEQQDDAINRQIDTGTGTYFSVCISFLKKEYPNFREEQIKDLYEACMKKPSPSETKIQAVRENTPTNIGKILQEEDVYLQLVDQLSFSYKEFCVKNNLKEGDPIPEKMQQIIVFEYLGRGGESKKISLSLAHFLLAPNRHVLCRGFFISALTGKHK